MSLLTIALLSLYLLSTSLVSQKLAAQIEVYPAFDLENADVGRSGAIVILGSGLNSDAPEYGAADTVQSA